MQGSVFQLAVSSQDDGLPHPHVVILTFSGNRDCIVIPAYSCDGTKVVEYIASMKSSGYREDQIFVRLDNSKYVDFQGTFPAKEAFWCASRFRRLAQKTVHAGKFIGTMSPAGMLLVARCLLNSAPDNPDLSPAAVKSLRKLVETLEAEASAS